MNEMCGTCSEKRAHEMLLMSRVMHDWERTSQGIGRRLCRCILTIHQSHIKVLLFSSQLKISTSTTRIDRSRRRKSMVKHPRKNKAAMCQAQHALQRKPPLVVEDELDLSYRPAAYSDDENDDALDYLDSLASTEPNGMTAGAFLEDSDADSQMGFVEVYIDELMFVEEDESGDKDWDVVSETRSVMSLDSVATATNTTTCSGSYLDALLKKVERGAPVSTTATNKRPVPRLSNSRQSIGRSRQAIRADVDEEDVDILFDANFFVEGIKCARGGRATLMFKGNQKSL
jgi:hypothetical protein